MSARPTLVIDHRERAIVLAGELLVLLYEHGLPGADLANQIHTSLINGRSPERVAQMEREKGLARAARLKALGYDDL